MILGSLRVPLLSLQTVDETTSDAVDCSAYSLVAIVVKGTGTVTTGVVTIEEADQNPSTLAADPYTGTWSLITTVDASSVALTDAQIITHLPAGAYPYIRTRISTVIAGGGSVSTVLRAC